MLDRKVQLSLHFEGNLALSVVERENARHAFPKMNQSIIIYSKYLDCDVQ